jgi:hypothetical protein
MTFEAKIRLFKGDVLIGATGRKFKIEVRFMSKDGDSFRLSEWGNPEEITIKETEIITLIKQGKLKRIKE